MAEADLRHKSEDAMLPEDGKVGWGLREGGGCVCGVREEANIRRKMNHSIDVWKEQYYDYMDLMTADI